MTSPLRVLVTRRLPSAIINRLKEKCEVDIWSSDEAIPRNILLEKISKKDGLLCLLTDSIDKEVLDHAGSSLRIVSTMSVGVDHIDIDECTRRSIAVGHTPDVLTAATVEFGMGLLLATSRRIVESVHAVKDGSWATWKPFWMCGPSIAEANVGLFGFGRLGQSFAQHLLPFKPKNILYNSRTKKSDSLENEIGVSFVNFETLLRESDFLICCCALTPDTQGIFDKNAFSQMKESSVFINIARGPVVNQDDLLHALTNKQIGAAGLDVTSPEPLSPEHPLLKLDNCIITPHIASASTATREKMALMASQNLMSGLTGEALPYPYTSS